MTMQQIAAETDFGRETVSYYLRRAGIPRPVGFVRSTTSIASN
jgi:hypothetical protein